MKRATKFLAFGFSLIAASADAQTAAEGSFVLRCSFTASITTSVSGGTLAPATATQTGERVFKVWPSGRVVGWDDDVDGWAAGNFCTKATCTINDSQVSVYAPWQSTRRKDSTPYGVTDETYSDTWGFAISRLTGKYTYGEHEKTIIDAINGVPRPPGAPVSGNYTDTTREGSCEKIADPAANKKPVF